MGNCISGLAFKPEDDDDEYRYGGRHPKTCGNIQIETSGRERAVYNNGSETHSDASLEKRLRDLKENNMENGNIQTPTSSRAKAGVIYRLGVLDDEAKAVFDKRLWELKEKIKSSDDIFEPRPVKSQTQSSSCEHFGYKNGLVGHPDAEANAAFEKRMRELKEKKKREEVVTKSSTVIRFISGPIQSEKVKEGIMDAMSELERELKLRGDSLHSIKLDMKDEEAEEEDPAQVRNKSFKREFRKKQPKVKKPRVSLKNFEASNNEAPNFDLESPSAEAEKKVVKNKKRFRTFQIPNNTFKKVADSNKRNRTADVKNRNRQRIALLA